MPAVAITDTGNLFGALEFAHGLRARRGFSRSSAASSACARGERRGRRRRAAGPAPPPDPLVLLAQNEAGYRNLLKLVSRSFLETEGGEAPQIDLGGARRA